MRNGSTGVYLNLSHAIVLDNTFRDNRGDGVTIFDNFCGHLNLFRVGSNVAEGNGNLGIDATPTPPRSFCALGGPDPYDLLDAGGNAASRNGNPQQCALIIECARNRGQANKLAPVAADNRRHGET